MRFDFDTVAVQDRYKLMTAAITPRPIAWVTSRSRDGIDNAAPFSFFNMMVPEPPLVALGMMRRPDGSQKDSARNILDTGEFVVNLVSRADAEAMNLTCIDAPPEVDEILLTGLATAPSHRVAPLRITSSPINLECRLFQAIEPSCASTVILGEVVAMHFADGLVDERLHVDTPAMELVARMHGAGWYTGCSDLFQMKRPIWAERDEPSAAEG